MRRNYELNGVFVDGKSMGKYGEIPELNEGV